MKQAIPAALLAAVMLAFAAVPAAAQETLSLGDVPSLVLGHDTSAALSAQTTLFALHTWKGTIARALPQLDFGATWSLAYTPSIQLAAANPSPPPLSGTATNTDQGTHLLDTKLTVSQLLPTAGSLLLTLDNMMTVSTIGGRELLGTTTNPDPRYSQSPSVALSIVQPLFFNGKVLDLDVFPATMRKAELGYLEQGSADLSQRNAVLGQAAQLFYTIVQLRRNIAQADATIEVARGTLAQMQQSYSLGSVAEADLLDVRIGLSRQQQARLELASTLARSERALAHSLGVDSLAGTGLDDTVPALAFNADRDAVVQRALAGHPLLKQKALSAEEKRVDKVISGQQFASTLTLSFSWSPRYPYDAANVPWSSTSLADSFTNLFADGSGSSYQFAAGLTLHLYDGGNGRESAAATAALGAVAEQGLLAQRQAVIDQVELDLAQKASLEEKIALLQDAADLGARRLATERSLLALGKSTDLDVASKAADARARADDLWRARADLYLTVLDLHALAGDDLSAIIEGRQQ
jgi:outer membrane protein TolC